MGLEDLQDMLKCIGITSGVHWVYQSNEQYNIYPWIVYSYRSQLERIIKIRNCLKLKKKFQQNKRLYDRSHK